MTESFFRSHPERQPKE